MAGSGVTAARSIANVNPRRMPTRPPKVDSVIDSVVRHDVAALRAERLPQADLTRPFADDHQHDVHDDDAADQQREGDDADEHGKDAVGGLGIESQDRV